MRRALRSDAGEFKHTISLAAIRLKIAMELTAIPGSSELWVSCNQCNKLLRYYFLSLQGSAVNHADLEPIFLVSPGRGMRANLTQRASWVDYHREGRARAPPLTIKAYRARI